MGDLKLECIETRIDEVGRITSLIAIPDLKPGQGITIGNALRRILLSEIKGTTISAVKLPGINHELSTVEGVREDVLEIFLNLKQIVFKRLEHKFIQGHIKTSGPGIITANMIQFPDSVAEIVNPNQYIATLTTSQSIKIDLILETDSGYRLSEQQQIKVNEFISLDSVFMPVLNVTYKITNEYLGQRETKEKLTLEITTNGSIEPSQALREAAKLLSTWFVVLSESIIEETTQIGKNKTIVTKEKILIEELQLPVRAYNCLKKFGIHSIDELQQYSQEEIKAIKNFGKKSALEVFSALENRFGIILPSTKK